MPPTTHPAHSTYASEVSRLASATTTSELSYYPAIRTLLSSVLSELKLPSDVRTGTAERRERGGADFPDLGIYDGTGDFVLVCGEVKLPQAEIADMAVSTERSDQVGRYLARTRAVILTNVRGFGLLTVDPGYTAPGPIPPDRRRLSQVVELWPSVSALREGRPIDADAYPRLTELVETAVTLFAPIGEPETLARVLARQARRAKAGLPEQFGAAVRELAEDFGRALGITFEDAEGEEFFRSSLVQTVYYGMFAGWLLQKQSGPAEPFRWRDLPTTLRIPFLGSLFYDIQHPERIRDLNLSGPLDDAAATLDRVDTESFFARLRLPRLSEGEDAERAAATAILYFYEPFLEAFDPELRKRLGVWYTPPEIVRYQVRKVDRLLREELGCELGFADENVVVLDPACGTGAYLIEVAQCIAETLRAEGVGDDLADRLIRALCRRVYGFEILTAPFVIAHLQLYLMLSALGAEPAQGERLAVFLTNALTGWTAGGEQMGLHFPELQQEHDAARAVKTTARVIVVIGNPPYNRFAGAPVDEESDLADHYKGIRRDERGRQVGTSQLYTEWRIRKHLLDDLYIRFFRLAETRIADRAEHGVVSFISNSSFYTGRSHPIMRESLLQGFDHVWIDNLHGNRLASERTPWGDSCETIFNMEGGGPGIKVGTGITTLVKRQGHRPGTASVSYRDFWGRAGAKRTALLDSLGMEGWSQAKREQMAGLPEGPREYVPFTPTFANRWKLLPREDAPGYEDWPSLDLLFESTFQGVNPARGLQGSVVEFSSAILELRMREYFSDLQFSEFSARHPVICQPRARYAPEQMRNVLRGLTDFRQGQLLPYVVFPLDLRTIYYETFGKLLTERSPKLGECAEIPGNEFLVGVTQPRRVSEKRLLFATSLFDYHLHDHGAFGFPAELVLEHKAQTALWESGAKSRANLTANAWETFKRLYELSGDLHEGSAKQLARRLMRNVLALSHSAMYQLDHSESLAQDWAHVPIPTDRALFDRLADAGDRVAALLDPLANPRETLRALLGDDIARLAVVRKVGGGAVRGDDYRVAISHYGAAVGGWRAAGPETGNLYINRDVYLENVPQRVWNYELGGYPVVKKWLGYRDERRRPGQPLLQEEVDHLRSIVHRIEALHRLHPELDALYTEACKTPLVLE